MAIGTTRTPDGRSPSTETLTHLECEQVIESQLERTSRFIRLVDVCGHLMTWAAGVLAALLLLVLIDHWVFGLPRWARVLTLIGLIGTTLLFLVRRLIPPLIWRVNPTYSARLIEKSEPSLKNSLISYLFLRNDRLGAHGVVYQAMQQQAAADIAQVDVDLAVDRSKMIHVGYVLVGILVFGGLYTILSPKDPFQTVARVAAPWMNIARPSRVQITDVQPGAAHVYQGRSVEVSALVRTRSGGTPDIPVWLVFSTPDGRIADRRIPMRVPEGQLRHRCDLPDDEMGVQQGLVYWIETGDAVSDSYEITLLPAPSIVVERIEYSYPAYTGRKPTVATRQRDVEGLEGTRVRVVARANQEIKSAYLEFDPDRGETPQLTVEPQPASFSSGQTIPMQLEGQMAEVQFTLALQQDRRRPWHSSYQLRFSTHDGETNREPVLYGIAVTPDLPPVVEILEPKQYEVEVPEDGQQSVEVRAVDPDYALNSLVIHAVSAGAAVLEQPLLSEPRTGQVTTKFNIIPRKLGLSAGDVALYWAEASDNRVAVRGGRPDPNTSRTTDYKIRVVAPQGPQATSPQADGGQRDNGASQDQPNEGNQGSPDDSAEGQPANDEGSAGQSPSDRGDKGERQEGQGGAEQRSAGDEPSDERGDSNRQSQTGGSEGEGAGEPATQGGQSDGAGQRGDDAASQKDPGAESDSAEQDSDKSGDQGAAGSRPKPGADDQSGAEGEEMDPVPSDGQRDGDAFERILKRMREQGEGDSSDETAREMSSPQENSPNASPDSDAPRSPESGADGEPGETTEQKRPGETNESTPRGAGTGEPGEDGNPSGTADKPGDTPRADAEKMPTDPAGGQDGGERERGPQDRSGNDRGDATDQGDAPDQGADQQDGTSSEQDAPQNQRAGDSGRNRQGDAAAEKDQADSDSQGADPDGDQASDASTANGQETDQRSDQPPAESKVNPKDGQGTASSDGGHEGGRQSEEGGRQSEEGSRQSEEGGRQSEEGGRQSEEGGRQSEEGGRQSEEGGRQSEEGGRQSEEGGRQSEEGGRQSEEGGRQSEEGGAPSQTSRSGADRTSDGQSRETEASAGGKPGTTSDPTAAGGLDEPGGDDPNIEYAQKATDLALDYLKDQQTQPDQELLDRLGWTKQDVQKFVQRWEQMKREAAGREKHAPQARRQLDDALRSLGLGPGSDRLRQGGGLKDGLRGVRESGNRRRLPAEYRDQYDAYLRSAARNGSGDDGE